MKFSCLTSDLLHGIQLVSRAIGGQQALPILGNILLKVEGNSCTVSATDLELSITTSFDAKIENEGSITVPAKSIMNFAQYTRDNEVLLETVEGTRLKCSSAKSKVMLAGESANDYPSIAAIDKQVGFTLPVHSLSQALHYVTFAAAKTSLRPVLSGVYMQRTTAGVTFVATDSYRLSEYTIPVEFTEHVNCIIPVKILDELKSIISSAKDVKSEDKKKEPTVEVSLSTQQIGVKVGNTQLLSRLIEGKFPDYKQIVPQEEIAEIALPLEEFSTTIKRMHYFSREVNNNLTFHYNNKNLNLLTPETQAGRDEADLPVEATGVEAKIALSSAYLLDFLAHVSGTDVKMHIADTQRPATFTLDSEPTLLHLIMPLRMQG